MLIDDVRAVLNRIDEEVPSKMRDGLKFIDALSQDDLLPYISQVVLSPKIDNVINYIVSDYSLDRNQVLYAVAWLRIEMDELTSSLEELLGEGEQFFLADEALFGPNCNIELAFEQCVEADVPENIFDGFFSIVRLQQKRLKSLLVRQSEGDDIKEKDINDAITLIVKIYDNVGKYQVAADMLEKAGGRAFATVQKVFNSWADAIPEDQRHVVSTLSERLTDLLSKRLPSPIEAENIQSVVQQKKKRGRPAKYLDYSKVDTDE